MTSVEARLTAAVQRIEAGTTPPAGAVHVLPAGGPTIQPDSNAKQLSEALMKEVDDRRLLAQVEFGDRFRGDLGAAVRLARVSFECYDPRRHRLSHLGGDERQPGEVSYSSFFREVAPVEFRGCRNVWAASMVLDAMIREATA